MDEYRTFLDGLALGVFLGFLAFYLFYRFRISRISKPKSDIDILVDDIDRYYQYVSEKKRRDFE